MKDINIYQIIENIQNRKWIIFGFFIIFILFFLALSGTTSNEPIKMILIKNSGFCMIILAILLALSIIAIILFESERIHILTFFIVFSFGIISSFVIPILDSPDEPTHFNRAELTSRLNLIPITSSDTTYEILQSVVELQNANQLSVTKTDEDEKTIQYNYVDVQANVAAGNVFVGYVFSALGINIAKSLNLSVIWMLWLGRICNVIISAVVCSFAVWITPKFKLQFLIISTMPMAIYQYSSFSVDALINSFAFLSIAMFLKLLLAKNESIRFRDLLGFVGVVIITGLLKLPYFSLILLFLCIPRSKFLFSKSFIWRIGILFFAFVIAVGWYFISSRINVAPNNQTKYVIANNINSLEQMKLILANPATSLKIIFASIFREFPERINGFFTFGWLDYGVTSIVPLYLVFYGVSMLMYPMDVVLDFKKRGLMVLISGIVIVATYYILYIMWTPVGAVAVEGIQSRYFIPLLLLMPMGLYLNTDRPKSGNLMDLICVSATLFFISITIMQTIVLKY